MYQRYFCALMILSVLSFAPAPGFAQTVNLPEVETTRVSVIEQQIHRLWAEVVRLQSLLKRQSASLPLAHRTRAPYESVIFVLPFEATYFVDGSSLRPAGQTSVMRPIDQELFTLFNDVLGEDIVREHVREWRVFNTDKEDLGAFVELIAGTNGWVVGVNRAGYVADDISNTRSFANLFIHEYAHVLLFANEAFVEQYQHRFWTTADAKHQSQVERLAEANRLTSLVEYYEANPTRFVSDYATLNMEEDLAETFVFFVREDKPLPISVRQKKILAFYEIPEFVTLRIALRANLEVLGVL